MQHSATHCNTLRQSDVTAESSESDVTAESVRLRCHCVSLTSLQNLHHCNTKSVSLQHKICITATHAVTYESDVTAESSESDITEVKVRVTMRIFELD